VIDYDTHCIDIALRRAAQAADQCDFPFFDDIHRGVVQYLESRCPLKLMHLDELYDRIRRMLQKIGCDRIAAQLRPLAPPVSLSLVELANQADNGFELVFFSKLRDEICALRRAGAEDIHFSGLRECAMILRGARQWNQRCQQLQDEIEAFIAKWLKVDANASSMANLAV
jgi:hypothetical protein